MKNKTKIELISSILKYKTLGELSDDGKIETFKEDGLIIEIRNLKRRAYTYSFLTLYNNSKIIKEKS